MSVIVLFLNPIDRLINGIIKVEQMDAGSI